jgi:orotate phosphoribosyltransferase
MSGAMSDERARLLELLRTRSFARRRVVLASGGESDFFIDCKQTVLTAEGHALCGEILFEAVKRFSPAAVAGVELGGCPLASAVALVSFQKGAPIDAIYVRKDAKDHGSRRDIEGNTTLAEGARVVLVEDVITTGGSTLKAVEKLRAAGYVVQGVVALVDRLEGGAENNTAKELTLEPIFTRLDFIPETRTLAT